MTTHRLFSRRALLSALPGAVLFGATPVGKLKVTKFVLHKATLRWRDLLHLEIHTDGGLLGIGEGSLHTRVEVVEQAIRTLELSVVAKYAFGLAQSFNAFYHRYSIINEERADARVWGAAAVAN